jgi:uncharacterized phage protein (TIGR01671 family)
MIREHKYRVYSFISKSFIYFDVHEGVSGIAGGVSEPQQYTGLTDKNGKEIYEGDIVQYNQNSSYDNMDFIAKWSDDKLGFIFQSNSGEQLVNQTPHLNRFKHLEVVGNIFENPELLK